MSQNDLATPDAVPLMPGDTLVLQDGWVRPAQHLHSPNFDARPDSCVPELLVIHAISLPLGDFSAAPSHIDQLFLNQLDVGAHSDFGHLRGVRLSAHFLIRRDGCLTQFVSVDQRAWHAGVSQFMGRERCNDFSIGIELEGSDFVPFNAGQYDTLIKLTQILLQHYPIKFIVGHADIAPARKTDPGPFFDWTLYQRSIQQHVQLVPANTTIRFRVDH